MIINHGNHIKIWQHNPSFKRAWHFLQYEPKSLNCFRSIFQIYEAFKVPPDLFLIQTLQSQGPKYELVNLIS